MHTQPIILLRKIRPFAGGFAFSMVLLAFAQTASAWTQTGTVFTTDGSQADVQSALYAATNGCTVNIPAGAFLWGTNSTQLVLSNNVILSGAGTNNTLITLADNAPSSTTGVINLKSACVVSNFTILVPSSSSGTAFEAYNANGWRINNIFYTNGTTTPYFAYAESAFGLIDHCNITGGGGTAELIFMRGYTNSWQTPDAMGTSNAVYIENCYFNGQGYVCDANANARAVIRFCTITGPIKTDGHGKASNTPPRGVRTLEVYDNHWTSPASSWTAMDFRGGSGICFSNRCDTRAGISVFEPCLYLHEYGCENLWPNFTNTYQTPINYPVDDQIGVGEDPKAAASDPFYLWDNYASNYLWQVQFEPSDIAAGAIALYTNQTGNVNATFTMTNLILANRDYYIDSTNTFNGSSGVGTGTYAQMTAITPTKTGVGFWVIDQGNWNTTAPTNSSGELYVWNGGAWVLKYAPYTYPYPYANPNPPPAPPSGLHPVQN